MLQGGGAGDVTMVISTNTNAKDRAEAHGPLLSTGNYKNGVGHCGWTAGLGLEGNWQVGSLSTPWLSGIIRSHPEDLEPTRHYVEGEAASLCGGEGTAQGQEISSCSQGSPEIDEDVSRGVSSPSRRVCRSGWEKCGR